MGDTLNNQLGRNTAIDAGLLTTFSRLLRWHGAQELQRGGTATQVAQRVWNRHTAKAPWLARYPGLFDELSRHVESLVWAEWADDEVTEVYRHPTSAAA